MKRYGKLKEVKDRALLKFDFLVDSWWMMQVNIYKIELSIEIIKKYQQNEHTKLKLWEAIQNSNLQHSVQRFTLPFMPTNLKLLCMISRMKWKF